jgi:hypothetical protein
VRRDARPGSDGNRPSGGPGFLDRGDFSSFIACDRAIVGYGRSKTANILEGEAASAVSEGVRSYALDPERGKALWAKSEEMVGERF